MSPTRNLSPNTDNSFLTSHAALDQYLMEENNKVKKVLCMKFLVFFHKGNCVTYV